MLCLMKIVAIILGAALLIAGFVLQIYAVFREVEQESKPKIWHFFGNLLEIIGVFGAVYVLLRV